MRAGYVYFAVRQFEFSTRAGHQCLNPDKERIQIRKEFRLRVADRTRGGPGGLCTLPLVWTKGDRNICHRRSRLQHRDEIVEGYTLHLSQQDDPRDRILKGLRSDTS